MKKLIITLALGNIAAVAVAMANEPQSFANNSQHNSFEFNSNKYLSVYQDVSQGNRQVKKDEQEVTVQTKDGIKVKAQPGKSKVETATYESKIKGDERKFKSKVNDTKVKSEPGKAKFESGDTKIKVKDRN